MTKKLREVREWARALVNAHAGSPWMWQRYKELISVIDELLAAQAATLASDDAQSAQGRDEFSSTNKKIIPIELARRRRVTTLPRRSHS